MKRIEKSEIVKQVSVIADGDSARYQFNATSFIFQ